MPAGATLDPASGQFAWTPGPDQVGDYPVQFSVSDGELGHDPDGPAAGHRQVPCCRR